MSAAEKLNFLLNLQDECGGAIPFDRWMHEALYHPAFGYYTANIRTVGKRGDFSTWATLHDSLGRGIASWARKNRPRSGKWNLIEIGAGNGDLAKSVLHHLGWWRRPAMHIVEVSPILLSQQQQKLRKAQWHDSLASALDACKGNALIYSNELADAFPCRIFQKLDLWRELSLRIENGKVQELWTDSTLPQSTAFSHDWPANQRVEVQESLRSWLQNWAPHWRKGAMLTIDYGDKCPQIYHRRPRGTLRSYAHHQRLEGSDIYAGFGQRDLTVDVNFSDLEKWAAAIGITATSYRTLGNFLTTSNVSAPADFLHGAGEAFQVLEQRPS